MKNREFYKDNIWVKNNDFGISKYDNSPIECTHCYNACAMVCKAFDIEIGCCELKKKWLDEEYKEPETDWRNVEVDTPVLVSDNGERWRKRYFAKYEGGRVCAWCEGATSWSVDDLNDLYRWEYAKLAKEDK